MSVQWEWIKIWLVPVERTSWKTFVDQRPQPLISILRQYRVQLSEYNVTGGGQGLLLHLICVGRGICSHFLFSTQAARSQSIICPNIMHINVVDMCELRLRKNKATSRDSHQQVSVDSYQQL